MTFDFSAAANYGVFLLAMTGLTALFTALYLWITPYRELALVRAGNTAAAVALVGAMIGFALAIKGVAHGATMLKDLLVWGAAASAAQLAAFFLASLLLRDLADGVRDDKVAYGVLLAGIHICAGLLNAGALSL